MEVVSRAVRKSVCLPEREQNVFQKRDADSLFPGNPIVAGIVVWELKNDGHSDRMKRRKGPVSTDCTKYNQPPSARRRGIETPMRNSTKERKNEWMEKKRQRTGDGSEETISLWRVNGYIWTVGPVARNTISISGIQAVNFLLWFQILQPVKGIELTRKTQNKMWFSCFIFLTTTVS